MCGGGGGVGRGGWVGLGWGVDGRGRFDAGAHGGLGEISGKSTVLYVMSERGAVSTGRHRRLYGVPTESMLADDLTKAMLQGSGLWDLIYHHGYWAPFRRMDLEEDYVTMESTGEVVRWRICNTT